jgi:uncharacterized repeat protein (TIGR01451 family)
MRPCAVVEVGRPAGRVAPALVALSLVLVWFAAVVGVSPAVAQLTPAPNPQIADQCGLPFTLVLDASGSIADAGAVEDVRDAGEAFLDAVKDTGSTARVVDFGTVARQTAPADLVTTQSMAPGGVHADALAAYYNPKPPVNPPNTYRYDGSGSVLSASNFDLDFEDQWTNWDGALDLAGRRASDLVLFVTDGNPTAADSDRAGDPFFVPGQFPPNARFSLSSGSAQTHALDRAIEEANQVKGAGTRILSIGVGDAFESSSAVTRLTRISGPNVAESADEFDIRTTDVTVVTDFDALAQALRGVVTELCSPSLTIRKFVQTAESATYVPAPGWDITVTPTVSGGTFDWILPNTTPATSKTVTTNNNGFAQFQWEPDPPTAPSSAVVTEVVEDDYVPGPALCEILGPEGPAEFIEFPSSASFTVPVGPQDIVTCTLRNNFDYQPGIELTKSADPVLVRGDPPGQTVTYTGVIDNTGNTPLVLSSGGDDICDSPIVMIGGDDDGDNRLDVDELWTFECTTTYQEPVTDEEIIVPNTASVTAVDPAGTTLSDSDAEEIEVLTPAITLEKTVDQATVAPGTQVEYTFTATNPGNDPLSDVELVDSNSNCTPTLVSGDTDTDGALDPGETWIYTCSAVIVNDPTINRATISGQPTLGDEVTDDDSAIVDVVYQDMELEKEVTFNLVFSGDQVTYTYTLTNEGGDDLVPPAGETPETVVTDPDCTPEFDGEDDLDDGILSPGEDWVYQCTIAITAPVLNIGTAVMEGPLGTITRISPELVVPLVGDIAIEKNVSDDLVQPGTEVTYTYEVWNTGQAELADVAVTDDPECTPLTFVGGDTDGDGFLDPAPPGGENTAEVFEFTCTATVDATVTNVATASGIPTIDDRTDEEVTATDDATVTVYDPDIALEKTVSDDLVPLGTPVTFTFVATNTGDSDLVPLGVTDDQCVPVEFVGESDSPDGVMQPDEQWTWECTKAMQQGALNEAIVVAVDIEGGQVSADDTAEVDVFVSEIDIEKGADPILVPRGGRTTFSFAVTNPSSVPLSDVTLNDDTCSPVRFEGGDTDGDGLLAPNEGETWTYTCPASITSSTSNVATVTGTDPGGGRPTDTAHAGAQPYEPGIGVVKTATPTQVPSGGTVTYRYQVFNTGNIPLADVENRIQDDTCAPVTFVSGDDDGNGLLTGEIHEYEISVAAEVWIFECTTTVTEGTTNTVTVSGVPSDLDGSRLGPDVAASATATVGVDEGAAPAEAEAELPFTGQTLPLTVTVLLLCTGAALVLTARHIGRPRFAPRP